VQAWGEVFEDSMPTFHSGHEFFAWVAVEWSSASSSLCEHTVLPADVDEPQASRIDAICREVSAEDSCTVQSDTRKAALGVLSLQAEADISFNTRRMCGRSQIVDGVSQTSSGASSIGWCTLERLRAQEDQRRGARNSGAGAGTTS
jgi:hypothetical protein